jgi:DinB superfamily
VSALSPTLSGILLVLHGEYPRYRICDRAAIFEASLDHLVLFLMSRAANEGGRTMNITAVFRDLHQGSPSRAIAFFDTLDETHWRSRPQPVVNSLAWLIWHMARVEDAGVNRLVANRPQVLDEGNWGERMQVPIRHHGTGMTTQKEKAPTSSGGGRSKCPMG